MMDVLLKAGHEVTLYTIEKTGWGPVEANWGVECKPREVWHLKDQRYTRLPLIRWPLLLILYLNLLVKAAKKRNYISLNNYGEVLPLFTDVSYIHSLPLSLSTNENPYAIPLWSVVKPLYQALLRIFSGHFSGFVLTNSKYNASKIKLPPQSHIVVLYPPVDHHETPHKPKTPSTLTASRVSKSKNLEIIPRIAKLVTAHCEFRLCLTTSLQDEASITPLRGPHITINKNPSKKRLNQLRQTSTIYLSTQPTEAYGLSLLEAMDAGCIPVVPRDGGPWHDILEEQQGKVGYAYNTPEEAAKQINKILNDAVLSEKLREAAKQRTRQYQGPSFSTNLLQLLTAIHAHKQRMCNQPTESRRT
jgi:glycosyltransferase involved in cell wall biosynthesis